MLNDMNGAAANMSSNNETGLQFIWDQGSLASASHVRLGFLGLPSAPNSSWIPLLFEATSPNSGSARINWAELRRIYADAVNNDPTFILQMAQMERFTLFVSAAAALAPEADGTAPAAAAMNSVLLTSYPAPQNSNSTRNRQRRSLIFLPLSAPQLVETSE
jgi:hypothetical protein